MSPRGPLTSLIAVAVAVAVVGVGVGVGVACAPGAPEHEHAEPATSCAAPAPRPAGLLLAGSGSNLAVVRRIAARYRAAHPGARVTVPESIGTGGATAALVEDAIDVGLASRPLTPRERAAGLVAAPFAATRMVFAAHPEVASPALSPRVIADIYAGRRVSWEGGRPIVPLLREPGDSGWPVLRAWSPEVERALAQSAAARRWRVCYTDAELRDALLAVPGSLGLVDEGTLRLERLPLRVLATLGAAAPAASERRGLKLLSFVTRGPPAGDAARFLGFALSPAVADVLREGAYLPP